MYAGKPGRDHLGLGSVSSDQILLSLSPSINVLTFHPRYHSFYVFLLDEFWRRERPQRQDALVDFYRPREFIFSVGVHLCDRHEPGDVNRIVGGQRVGPLVSRYTPAYQTQWNYIKTDMGGYELYYRSVMAELGLILPAVKGVVPVDLPTPEGKRMASAFRQAVQDTEYYRKYFELDDCEIPAEVVLEYGRRACLCQLKQTDTPDRPFLLKAFLYRGRQKDAAFRRGTLALLLDIADQTDGLAVDEDSFRQILYFRETEAGHRYSPRKIVLDAYLRWRLYQAREYYSFALNALWFYLCEWGIDNGGELAPLPLQRFFDHLREGLDFNQLADRLGLPRPGLSWSSRILDLEDWLVGLSGTTRDGFDYATGIHSPIQEHRLYRMAAQSTRQPDASSQVAGMVILLALIHLRFGKPALWTQPEWEISRMGGEARLSVDTFLRNLEKRLSGQQTIGEILRWLYSDYIVQQHQLVATSKLPDSTFRFMAEGSSLWFFRYQNSLDFLNSRFEAISTHIYDLGLCGNLSNPSHALSQDGKRFLETGDLIDETLGAA